MDISTHLFALSGFLFVVLLFRLFSKKPKGQLPPEIPGAFPIIGHLHKLAGNEIVARTFSAMADKYNTSIFSIRLGAHRAVVISTMDEMRECFTKNDKLFAYRPPSSQAKYLGYNSASFGLAPYGPYWRAMRKLVMMEILSNQRLKIIRHSITSEVDTFISELYARTKTEAAESPVTVDMTELMKYLVLNIITKMVAGKHYFKNVNGVYVEEGVKDRPIGSVIREFMDIVIVMVPSDLIPMLKWFDVAGMIKKMKSLGSEMDSIMEDWINEHKKRRAIGETNTAAKQDLIDVMLNTIEDDDTHGHKREVIIKATAMSLLVAGSDTTSIGMIWVLSVLLNNRHCLKKVQEELDEKVGRDRLVEDSDIEKLHYFQAVIKETLRLYPPGPVSTPHWSAEDCYISGYFIPKGTFLFPNLWKLHRDPKVWSDPDEFIPERFLTSKAEVDVSGQHFEYLPFGTGRRACPGLNFAMQVMQTTLARLLQGFNLGTPGNEAVDMTESKSIALPKATNLEMTISPRLAPALY